MVHSSVWGRIGESGGRGKGDGDNASGVKKDKMFESTSTVKNEEKGDNDNISMGGG